MISNTVALKKTIIIKMENKANRRIYIAVGC